MTRIVTNGGRTGTIRGFELERPTQPDALDAESSASAGRAERVKDSRFQINGRQVEHRTFYAVISGLVLTELAALQDVPISPAMAFDYRDDISYEEYQALYG